MDEKLKEVSDKIGVTTAEAAKLCFELTRVGVPAAELGASLRKAMIKIQEAILKTPSFSIKNTIDIVPKIVSNTTKTFKNYKYNIPGKQSYF